MKQRCLVAIWLDGFRTEYLNKEKTPYIYRLSEKSLVGEQQSLLAFAGIGVSIFTGVTPSKHGIWTEFCYDPERSPFRWVRKVQTLSRSIDLVTEGDGLGQLLRKALLFSIFKASKRFFGRTYMPMAWKVPVHVLHYFDTSQRQDILADTSAPLFDMLRKHGIKFNAFSESKLRDHQIFKRAMRIDRDVRLVFMQFSELDIVGHAKGPSSREMRRSLRNIDTKVHRIVESYQELFDLDVFIFADHGMMEVRRTVNPLRYLWRAGLKQGKDYLVFLDSTLARLWILNPEAADRVAAVVRRIKGGKLLSTSDLEQYSIPIDRKYGDIIWLADPGTLILPNYYQGSVPARGMHGYAPEVRDLNSPFIIYSRYIDAGRAERPALPMDIFSTILDLVGVPVPQYTEGRSLLVDR